MKLFLAPHNDDETLFGAYTCLRHKPHIIVVLRSFVEAEQWDNGATWEVREAETAAACEILGCSWEQWDIRDDAPDWKRVAKKMKFINVVLEPTEVWIPFKEPGGHWHHNMISDIATGIFNNVHYYATYSHANGKTREGTMVVPEEGWIGLKNKAMQCYQSQATDHRTQAAFNIWTREEYEVSSILVK